VAASYAMISVAFFSRKSGNLDYFCVNYTNPMFEITEKFVIQNQLWSSNPFGLQTRKPDKWALKPHSLTITIK